MLSGFIRLVNMEDILEFILETEKLFLGEIKIESGTNQSVSFCISLFLGEKLVHKLKEYF